MKQLSQKTRANDRAPAARSSITPLMRCARDPNACPASGSIVALVSAQEAHPCIVCGRELVLRGRVEERSHQLLARIPSHRRADLNLASDGKARVRVERLRCKLEQAERTARDALSRRAPARASHAFERARAIAERLPRDSEVERRLDRLGARVFRARERAKIERSTMPRDPKRLIAQIMSASDIDLGAVEPDGWIEHLASALPHRSLAPIAKEPSTRWMRMGLEALLRRSRSRSWDDLEQRAFAGQRSLMAFLREFPGLELLRLPDRAYEASIARAMIDQDVPF